MKRFLVLCIAPLHFHCTSEIAQSASPQYARLDAEAGGISPYKLPNGYKIISDRKVSCDAASSLVAYGVNGMDRDVLSSKMEKLKATWNIRLALTYTRQKIGAYVTILEHNCIKFFNYYYV